MHLKKFILIISAIFLLAGCATKAPQDTPNPSPSSVAIVAASPSPSPQSNIQQSPGSSVEGVFQGATPTSVQVLVGDKMEDYPSVAKVKKDADDLGIKQGDKVIVNMNGNTAQSIEKVVSK